MKLVIRSSLMSAAILCGCSAEVAEPIGSTSEELEFALATTPAPPKNADDQPECWWTQPGQSCALECGAATGGGSGGPTFRVAARAAQASSPGTARLAGSSGSSSSASRFVPDLDLQTPWCPNPTGDGICVTCMPSKYFPEWLKVTEHVGSKMLVTNGGKYDDFTVGEYAGLEGNGAPTNQWVNLAGGLQDPDVVDFDRDVYIQFTLENESGLYPVGGWNRCRPGQYCEHVPTPSP